MSKSKESPFLLRARRYPGLPRVVLWLIRRDGPAEATVMHGLVPEPRVAEVAAATGLTVEWEDHPLPVSLEKAIDS